ncbi:cytochrome P450 [Penicillium canescens]|nr:cytochrome P450 [Penicillium canescens]
MPYGQAWRNQRKIYQAILSITAVRALTPLQDAEATLTLYQLAQSPELYYDHIRRYSTAVILSSVFGIRGPEFNHPNVTRLYHVQDQFTAILETGATPPLTYFPSSNVCLTSYPPGAVGPAEFELSSDSFTLSCCRRSRLLDEKAKYELDDEHIAYIGGVLMEGGSDTTASTLLSFLLAMVKYPKVFRKAQEEVDRVCGTKESPTFELLAHLPYVKHCVSEVLRWRPVAAGGIPHVLIQDDEYKGYKFPTGSTFLANAWAIHHDPELYDCPDDFVPERYEHNPLGFKSDIEEVTDGIRKTYGFGAGRRICPGFHLAENSLHINVAKVLWAFDIRAGTDPTTGRPLQAEEVNVDIATQWTDGFLIAPKPFPIVMSLRSEKHREVLDRELDEAQKVFQRYQD